MDNSNELSVRMSLTENAARGAPIARAGPLLAPILAAVASTAADWFARYQATRRAQAAHYAMRHLSDHMLRDLGYERRANTWTAADKAADAEVSRDRFAQSYFDFLR